MPNGWIWTNTHTDAPIYLEAVLIVWYELLLLLLVLVLSSSMLCLLNVTLSVSLIRVSRKVCIICIPYIWNKREQYSSRISFQFHRPTLPTSLTHSERFTFPLKVITPLLCYSRIQILQIIYIKITVLVLSMPPNWGKQTNILCAIAHYIDAIIVHDFFCFCMDCMELRFWFLYGNLGTFNHISFISKLYWYL